jgi:hypothetical protein
MAAGFETLALVDSVPGRGRHLEKELAEVECHQTEYQDEKIRKRSFRIDGPIDLLSGAVPWAGPFACRIRASGRKADNARQMFTFLVSYVA